MDTLEDDLHKRLMACPALVSLKSEKELTERIIQGGWYARQSSYYQDPKTGKPREIDIDAWRVWYREVAEGQQLVRVHLVVEVKSIRDCHVVFSSATGASRPGASAHQGWLGHHRERGEELLRSVGLDPSLVPEVARRLKKLAYPRELSRVTAAVESQISSIHGERADELKSAISAARGDSRLPTMYVCSQLTDQLNSLYIFIL